MPVIVMFDSILRCVLPFWFTSDISDSAGTFAENSVADPPQNVLRFLYWRPIYFQAALKEMKGDGLPILRMIVMRRS